MVFCHNIQFCGLSKHIGDAVIHQDGVMGFTSFVANEGNIVSLGLFYGKYPVLEN